MVIINVAATSQARINSAGYWDMIAFRDIIAACASDQVYVSE